MLQRRRARTPRRRACCSCNLSSSRTRRGHQPRRRRPVTPAVVVARPGDDEDAEPGIEKGLDELYCSRHVPMMKNERDLLLGPGPAGNDGVGPSRRSATPVRTVAVLADVAAVIGVLSRPNSSTTVVAGRRDERRGAAEPVGNRRRRPGLTGDRGHAELVATWAEPRPAASADAAIGPGGLFLPLSLLGRLLDDRRMKYCEVRVTARIDVAATGPRCRSALPDRRCGGGCDLLADRTGCWPSTREFRLHAQPCRPPGSGDRARAAGQRAGRRRPAAVAGGGLDLRPAGCRPGCRAHGARRLVTRRSTARRRGEPAGDHDRSGYAKVTSSKRRCAARPGRPGEPRQRPAGGEHSGERRSMVSASAWTPSTRVLVGSRTGARRRRRSASVCSGHSPELGLKRMLSARLRALRRVDDLRLPASAPPSDTAEGLLRPGIDLDLLPGGQEQRHRNCSPVSTVAGLVPTVLRSPSGPVGVGDHELDRGRRSM